MFDGCTSAFATLVLAKFVAQTVYKAHIKDNPAHHQDLLLGEIDTGSGSGTEHTCYGTDCFQLSHQIEIGMVASGALSLLVLSWRVSGLYQLRWSHEELAKRQADMLVQ